MLNSVMNFTPRFINNYLIDYIFLVKLMSNLDIDSIERKSAPPHDISEEAKSHISYSKPSEI
jgi:hypothetical protein